MSGRLPRLGGSGGSAANAIITSSITEALASIANHTVVEATAGGGGITLTLPAAASNTGWRFTIRKVDGAAGAVIIDGNASETIDGDLTYVLTNEWQYIEIVSNGTNWSIVANN